MKYNSETKFIANLPSNKVIDVIIEQLKQCDKFDFTVSFVMSQGLQMLLPHIKAALDRGAEGRIVTSDYMSITDVAPLFDLVQLMMDYPLNFEAYFVEINNKNNPFSHFHPKGYVFTKGDETSILVGSSNMSKAALTEESGEWSLFSRTNKEEQLSIDVNDEIEKNIKAIGKKLNNQQIEDYTKSKNGDYVSIATGVKPNFMQEEALKALDLTRNKGLTKALIVAAMGSGKTYLSAFDAKNTKAKTILYVCHSSSVLRRAKTEFETVFGQGFKYGFYADGSKDFDVDILFATNISLKKDLNKFDTNRFDYIIIDEAHHAPASTFNAIIKHFNPGFLLGMTGTPDRLDQKNVRELFGDLIPFEMSLKDAIKQDLIMPFVYVSVNDDLVNYSKKHSSADLFNEMTSVAHGSFIKKHIEANRYRINGKLKCLAFTVDVAHAKQLTNLMNSLGYHCDYITGNTTVEDREKLFRDLQDEENELEILFSINVLNEGVNLPNINMSLFLRPTESTIIFVQQLGRALRKAENKNKPVIIDFIGQKYERVIYTAWALGELVDAPVLTKPIIRSIIRSENQSIKSLGVELNIDDESRKEIEDQLNATNFNTLKILRESFDNFRVSCSIASYPKHTEFITRNSGFDLMRIINTHGSYYSFLKRISEPNLPKFNKVEIDFIEYLSSLLPLSRSYEYRIISALLDNKILTHDELIEHLKAGIGEEFFSLKIFEHAILFLLGETRSEKDKINKPIYLQKNENVYSLGLSIEDAVTYYNNQYIEIDFNNSLFKTFVIDLLNYGLMKFEEEVENELGNFQFKLHYTYSRQEFTRLALLNSVYTPQQGVIYYDDGQKVALFIDLIKKADVEEHLNYGDEFTSKNEFIWESQTETEIGNNRYKKLVAIEKAEIFVRKFQKEDGVSLPYVYLGKGVLTNPEATDNVKKTVKFNIKLDNELTDDLYEQFKIKIN